MSEKQYDDLENDSEKALNIILINLCNKGDLESIKENLTSKTAKNHGDIYYDDNFPFQLLMNKGHLHVIEYLIFEYKMEKTSSLEKLLNLIQGDMPEKVNNMFKVREVNELSKELTMNAEEKNKKPKL